MKKVVKKFMGFGTKIGIFKVSSEFDISFD
jgi:hypothetical protein